MNKDRVIYTSLVNYAQNIPNGGVTVVENSSNDSSLN